MISKRLFFLSGLARSGSTLLGSILNQHPDVHVTPTSPVLDLVCGINSQMQGLHAQYTWDKDLDPLITSAVVDACYKRIPCSTVFDKHRGWTSNIRLASQHLYQEFKGIVTHRPVPEVLVSFIKLFDKDPNNWIDNMLRRDGRPINVRSRCDFLWRYAMLDPYNSTAYAIQNHADVVLPLSYDSIATDTRGTLKLIEKFFDIPGLADLQLESIVNTCAENDTAWGVQNLHTIRPTIERTSDDARLVLGSELYEYYSQFNIKTS
jgi:sulfotransferase